MKDYYTKNKDLFAVVGCVYLGVKTIQFGLFAGEMAVVAGKAFLQGVREGAAERLAEKRA